MDMGRFLIETHLRTGQPIGELAAGPRGAPQLALQAASPATGRKAKPVSRRGRDVRRTPPHGSPTSTRTRSWPCARSWPRPGSMPGR